MAKKRKRAKRAKKHKGYAPKAGIAAALERRAKVKALDGLD